MRISDWSSDVCSSDLAHYGRQRKYHHGHDEKAGIDLCPAPAELLLQWTVHHAQGIYVRLGDHDPDDGSKHDTPVRTPFTLAFSANQAVGQMRSEEHTSELQSLMRISYAVFCLKKKKQTYLQ